MDNGHGIPPEELPLAFANHATSKLASADDLFNVAHARLSRRSPGIHRRHRPGALQSRLTPTNDRGRGYLPLAASLSEVRAWNGGAGTRIEVRHLFYNTPVRRKFLRTPGTEMGHICEVLTRAALAKPGLHLTLRHNGKEVYEVAANTGLLQRIELFFGPEVKEQLYPLDGLNGPAHLFGYIADPACERGNGKMQYLFLNGRWIRDRSLGHALQEAYRGLLMTGRYATAFLFLDLPADHVDVNVHPTKAEVRFRDGSALYGFFLSTIRNRLEHGKPDRAAAATVAFMPARCLSARRNFINAAPRRG